MCYLSNVLGDILEMLYFIFGYRLSEEYVVNDVIIIVMKSTYQYKADSF